MIYSHLYIQPNKRRLCLAAWMRESNRAVDKSMRKSIKKKEEEKNKKKKEKEEEVEAWMKAAIAAWAIGENEAAEEEDWIRKQQDQPAIQQGQQVSRCPAIIIHVYIICISCG